MDFEWWLGTILLAYITVCLTLRIGTGILKERDNKLGIYFNFLKPMMMVPPIFLRFEIKIFMDTVRIRDLNRYILKISNECGDLIKDVLRGDLKTHGGVEYFERINLVVDHTLSARHPSLTRKGVEDLKVMLDGYLIQEELTAQLVRSVTPHRSYGVLAESVARMAVNLGCAEVANRSSQTLDGAIYLRHKRVLESFGKVVINKVI